MRSRKAAFNTAMGLLDEVVAVICGLILPRMILTAFGSKYNGLANSITQFLTCAVLLRSGIGGVTRAALYKPLAENDHKKIDSIIKATDIFMRRVATILAGCIITLACIYPFFVRKDFSWFFTFSLFLIIGASTFAESFFGITYLIVLQADQRVWVTSLIKIVCTTLNTIIAVGLISCGASIHIVKLGSAFVFVLNPVILRYYVIRHYHIDTKAKPDNSAIAQRWDAFWQQVCLFVMDNTDVMVLTIFSNILEVSVYSVYSLVLNAFKKLFYSLSASIEGAFGDMLARNEKETLKRNLSLIETLLFGMATVIYSSTAILVFDFIRLYTKGVKDVNYIRPVFAYIMIAAHLLNVVRIPSNAVVSAAGHYKQTKNGAIIEALLNISISILFVSSFGLVGVAIGTLVATSFRTVQYSLYLSKHIVFIKRTEIYKRYVVLLLENFLISLSVNRLPLGTPINYFQWVLKSVIVVVCACCVVILFTFLLFKDDINTLKNKIKHIFYRN